MNSRRIRDEMKEKYRLVQRKKTPLGEDEIRVSAQGRVPKYVKYGLSLLNEQDKPKITIKATGSAISSAITLAEILKRRVPMLHQTSVIGMAKSIDVYEPLLEGLNQLTVERDVPCIEIIVTKDVNFLDVKSAGYQPPIDQNQPSQTQNGNNSNGNSQDNKYFNRGSYRGRRNFRRPFRGRKYNNYNDNKYPSFQAINAGEAIF